MTPEEGAKLVFTQKLSLLHRFAVLPAFDLTKAGEAAKWVEEQGKVRGLVSRITWTCSHCEEPHIGILGILHAYDTLPKKFTLGSYDLSGSHIIMGYKHIRELLLPVGPVPMLLTRDGKLKDFAPHLHRHIADSLPMSEDEKVEAMLLGFTPEQMGRESWDD
jgi:hypothetical protein